MFSTNSDVAMVTVTMITVAMIHACYCYDNPFMVMVTSYYDNTHTVAMVTYIHPVAFLWFLDLDISYVQAALKLTNSV